MKESKDKLLTDSIFTPPSSSSSYDQMKTPKTAKGILTTQLHQKRITPNNILNSSFEKIDNKNKRLKLGIVTRKKESPEGKVKPKIL